MKIYPVSFGIKNNSYKNESKTNFNQSAPENSCSSNPLKTVPAALILAMCPAVVPAQTPQISNDTTIVSEVSHVKVIGKKELKTDDGNEFCRFIAYNTDENTSNAELLGFNYNCYTDDGNIGVMSGTFQAICPVKTEDDKYLALYEEIVNSQNTGIVNPCLIPAKFGDYLVRFAKSRYNNDAVDIVSKELLEKEFGKDEINSVKNLNEQVTTVVYPEN